MSNEHEAPQLYNVQQQLMIKFTMWISTGYHNSSKTKLDKIR